MFSAACRNFEAMRTMLFAGFRAGCGASTPSIFINWSRSRKPFPRSPSRDAASIATPLGSSLLEMDAFGQGELSLKKHACAPGQFLNSHITRYHPDLVTRQNGQKHARFMQIMRKKCGETKAGAANSAEISLIFSILGQSR